MIVKQLMDDNKKPYFKISTPKLNAEFIVRKGNNGFSFYEITSSKGAVADCLAGNWVGPDTALKAVEKYLNGLKKPSATVQRDEKRKEAVASKVQSDN